MGNVGTIIRTLTGMGVNNLAIIGDSADIFDPKVVRSSMGALFSMNFEKFGTINEYSEKFNERNLYPFTLGGKSKLGEVEFNEPYSLIFGNEGEGLGSEYNEIGTSIQIPQSEGIDSFNLSVSVAIALWEARKS